MKKIARPKDLDDANQRLCLIVQFKCVQSSKAVHNLPKTLSIKTVVPESFSAWPNFNGGTQDIL